MCRQVASARTKVSRLAERQAPKQTTGESSSSTSALAGMSEGGGGVDRLTLLTAMQARLHALGLDLHGRPMRILGMGALAHTVL
jgi:hypothetical protein